MTSAFEKDLVDRCGRILSLIDFQDYTFTARASHGGVFIQGVYAEPDTYSGVVEKQTTRKWLISPQMTDSEIVQTVFKCCVTSMEHRAREGFRYKRERVFAPHFNVEDLVAICRKGRERAGGREPAPALQEPDAREAEGR